MVPEIFITAILMLSVGGLCAIENSRNDACVRAEPCEPDTLVSNVDDCKKYWQCLERGEWVERECQDNGMFDYLLNRCVHADNVTCHPACHLVPCELPIPCVASSVIPDPNDCHLFYQCSVTGVAWQGMTCINGTSYDYMRSECTMRGNCVSNCLRTIPPFTNAHSSTSLNSSNVSTSLVIVDPCRRPTPCTEGSITADTHICKRYLQCLPDGNWTVRLCPTGGEFDYKKGYCVKAGNATCHPVCPTDLNCERKEPCSLNKIVPDPFNCDSFYQCDASLEWVRRPCPNNLFFDMRIKVCVDSSVVVCHPECQIDPCEPLPPKCPKAGVRVPAVDDCIAYYECPDRDGDWVRMRCSPSTKFDYITKECKQYALCHPGCTGMTTERPTTGPGHPELISHSLEQITPEAMEGQAVEFQCAALATQGVYSHYFTWFLHGLKIRNNGQKFKMNETRGDWDNMYRWAATLVIDPVEIFDIGSVNCSFLTDTDIYSEVGLYLDILTKPLIATSELSITVPYKGNLNISFYVQTQGGDAALEWYRNDDVLTSNDNERIIQRSEREYSLEVTDIKNDVTYGCIARNRVGESKKAICEVAVAQKGIANCVHDNKNGIEWTVTAPGHISKQDCPGNATGIATRKCNSSGGETQWDAPNVNGCVDIEYRGVMVQISNMETGLGIETPEVAMSVAHDLEEITNSSLNSRQYIKPGNLKASATSVLKLAQIHEIEGAAAATGLEIESITQTASNLLAKYNLESWRSILKEDRFGAVGLMASMDKYSTYLARDLDERIENMTVAKYEDNQRIKIDSDNIALSSTRWTKGDLSYPPSDKPRVNGAPADRALIPEITLTSIAKALKRPDLLVSNIYYRTLHLVLPVERTASILPSRVMTISIDNLPENMRFTNPIQLQFSNTMVVYSNDTRACSFWNYTSEPSGNWSSSGCTKTFSDGNITRCECDHLTNFAILVSRYRPDGDHHFVLSLLTTIGLVISIVCMVITLIIYGLLWKSIKSDYTLMLMNICGALIVANLVFLVAIDQTQIQVLCAIIAAVLHYLFLAAFFLMLAEAIELLLYVVYVFHVHTRNETVGLLLSAWGAPLLIVVLTMGITRGHGYGNDRFCWLTVENGVLWAFLGPVIAIVVCNICILGVVVKTLIASGKLRNEKQSDRLRSAAWNVLVLSPTLGLSWAFGLFAINENTLVFQYIFTSLNAFQGLFIFVFHCVFNKRVRDALQEKYLKDASFSLASSSSGGGKNNLRKGSVASRFATSESNLGVTGQFQGNKSPYMRTAAHKSRGSLCKHKNTDCDLGKENSADSDKTVICAQINFGNISEESGKRRGNTQNCDKLNIPTKLDEPVAKKPYDNVTLTHEYTSIRI